MHASLWPVVLAGVALLLTVRLAAAQPAPPPVTITVKPPPPRLVLLSNRETSLVVTAGAREAKNVRVVQASLQEATTGALLGANVLRLCLASDAACQAPVSIAAGETQRLVLRIEPSFTMPGTFTGSVLVAVDGRAGTDSFDLTVVSTSRGRQILGAALIVLGILCAWPVTLGLRQRAMRADALRPVAQLVGELNDVLQALTPARRYHPFTQLDGRAQRIRARLAPDALETAGYLPPKLPSPWRAPADRSAEFRQLLADQAVEIAALGVVVREGVLVVIARTPAGAAVPPAAATALQSLDALAATVTAVAAARSALPAIVQPVVAPGAPAAAAAPMPPGAASVPTVRELTAELHRMSLAVWLLVAGVTAVTGVLVLVATNYAFGVGLDYWKCFLWGLGIQGAGQQLQQLTPASAASAFNVSFPKS